MPQWVTDQTDWKFRVPNQPEETKIQVAGVMDATESERAKIFLRDDVTNQGPSVLSEAGAAEGVKSLAASMNIRPEDADWYAQGKDGPMYAIGLSAEQRTVEDPQYTALKNTELPEDLKEAKKAFPDLRVEALKAEFREITPTQEQEINACYQAAGRENGLEKSVVRENAAREQEQKPAHEYDLSH